MRTKKRLDDLENRLEDRIARLENKVIFRYEKEIEPYGFSVWEKTNINEVIQLILDYLGLKIEEENIIPRKLVKKDEEQTNLKRKEKDE